MSELEAKMIHSLCALVAKNVGDKVTYMGDIYDFENPVFMRARLKKVEDAKSPQESRFFLASAVYNDLPTFLILQSGDPGICTIFFDAHMKDIWIEMSINIPRYTDHASETWVTENIVNANGVFRALRIVWEYLKNEDRSQSVPWKTILVLRDVSESMDDEWNSMCALAESIKYKLITPVAQYLELISSLSQHACFIPTRFEYEVSMDGKTVVTMLSSGDVDLVEHALYIDVLHYRLLPGHVKYLLFLMGPSGHTQLCILDRRDRKKIRFYLFDPEWSQNNSIDGTNNVECFRSQLRSLFPGCQVKSFSEVCELEPQSVSGGGTCQLWCTWLAKKCLLNESFDPEKIAEMTAASCDIQNESALCRTGEELKRITDDIQDMVVSDIFKTIRKAFDCGTSPMPDYSKYIYPAPLEDSVKFQVLKMMRLEYLIPLTAEEISRGHQLYSIVAQKLSELKTSDPASWLSAMNRTWTGDDLAARITGYFLRMPEARAMKGISEMTHLMFLFVDGSFYNCRPFRPSAEPSIEISSQNGKKRSYSDNEGIENDHSMKKIDSGEKPSTRYGLPASRQLRLMKDCSQRERLGRIKYAVKRYGKGEVRRHLMAHKRKTNNVSIQRMIERDMRRLRLDP